MKMITIMPDFGMSPYAWIKDDSDKTTWVGTYLADAVSGFEFSAYNVSKALEAEFAAWATVFENHSDEEAFNWTEFHARGIALARRLKRELGDQVRVVYDTPVEDPSYRTYRGIDVRTEILPGGELKLVAFREGPNE